MQIAHCAVTLVQRGSHRRLKGGRLQRQPEHHLTIWTVGHHLYVSPFWPWCHNKRIPQKQCWQPASRYLLQLSIKKRVFLGFFFDQHINICWLWWWWSWWWLLQCEMMMRMMKSVQGRGAVGHRWGTHHYLHNYYPSITKSSSFLMLDIEQAGTNWPKCT